MSKIFPYIREAHKEMRGKLLARFYQDPVVINSLTTRDEIAEFANSVDIDEVAHNEPPHLDLHCLPSNL